ncbi:MAG: hydantoin utilization protein A [Acidobacteriota bacterium]|nr:MAG: hydantoin utilization protein A [Acidobacteriota bacterium]
MSWVGLATFGFLLGMRHAFEADHVAALASLSTRPTSWVQAVRIGAVWGLGHTLTLFIVGTIVLLADTVVPERIAWGLELAVGFMLVGLGADVLRRLLRARVHFHAHTHDDGTTHFHAHSHAGRDSHGHSHGFPGRALVVGLMHGMAGSAALVLLAIAKAPSVATGLVYIGVFGMGSILGMALLSVVISMPLRYSAQSMKRFHNGLQGIIGVATVLIGFSLIFDLTR